MTRRRTSKLLLFATCFGFWLVTTLLSGNSITADETTFFHGIKLNGPAVVIDGHSWKAGYARGPMPEGPSASDNVTFFTGTYSLRPHSTGPFLLVNSAIHGMPPGPGVTRTASIPTRPISTTLSSIGRRIGDGLAILPARESPATQETSFGSTPTHCS